MRRPSILPLPSSIFVLFVCTLGAAADPISSIRNSPHNLSASGPGVVKATGEQQVCVFCHTPHNAAPIQPLWNRATPASAYRVYSSKSLDALPGQPTGSSKLCLSCHDGTIALGSVLSRAQRIEMAGGMTVLPPGKSNLGTDLSDDHPISFKYDAALAAKDLKLKDPTQLPEAVKLDHQQELQCTSCHEPHDNSKGKFLVMDNSNSQLCASCHRLQNTNLPSHANCASCHQPHTAPSGPFLLKAAKTTDTCTTCHGPTRTVAQAVNVAADLAKLSRHDTGNPVNQMDHVPNNSDCSDCHGPHTMKSGTASAPTIPPHMGQIDGVNAAGSPVASAQYEYEVCFKCHAEQSAAQPFIRRQIVQANTRLEFASTAISFHPVEQRGRSTDVPSLNPGLTTSTIIYCNDCHNSDSGRKAGGTGPDGVHGSNYKPLLALRYETLDGTSESAGTYALCYKCHSRTSILGDVSFKSHRLHIIDKQTPCSVCHDAHGISSAQGSAQKNSRLINFDTSVVTADPATGRLEFNQTGIRQGACFLSCHGTTHSGTTYTGDALTAPGLRRALPSRSPVPAPLSPRRGAAPAPPRR
jgi:predicted CXXCH cytochrome family protein